MHTPLELFHARTIEVLQMLNCQKNKQAKKYTACYACSYRTRLSQSSICYKLTEREHNEYLG